MKYLSFNVLSVKLSTESERDYIQRKSAIELFKRSIKGKGVTPSLLPLLLAACGGGSGASSPSPTTPTPPAPTPDFTESPTNTFTARDDNNRTLSESGKTVDLTVTGKGGNDTITTGSGNDAVDGAAGNDTITTNGGADIVVGGEGNDTISSGDGDDMVLGGAGADTTATGGGDDIIVLIGITSADQYTDSAISNPAGTDTNLASLLTSISDINDHSISDVASGETIDGGDGSDTLVIYGEVDISGIAISNITTLWVNSTLTLTAAQLNGITTVNGDGSSILKIVGSEDNGVFDQIDLSAISMTNIGSIISEGNVELLVSDSSQLSGISTLLTTPSLVITIASGASINASDLVGIIAAGAHVNIESGGTLVLDTITGVDTMGALYIGGAGNIVVSDAVSAVTDSLQGLRIDNDVSVKDTSGTLVDAWALGGKIINDIEEGTSVIPIVRVLDVTTSESEQTASLTFELNATYYEEVSFDYSSSNGEGGTVTFAAGSWVASIVQTWTDDDVDDGITYYGYSFSNPQNVLFTETSAIIKVLDNDGLPYISIESVYAVESVEIATFTATLSRASNEIVSFYHTSFDGKTLHKVIFEPGEITQTYTVTWDDDDIAERDITYNNIYVKSPYNATFNLAPGLAVIVIDDDGLELDGSPDYSASRDTQALMEIGTPFSGYFSHSEDVDWIAVELVAGQSYSFEMSYDAPVAGHLETDLINPRGTYGGGSGGGRNDGTIIYNLTATESGTYYIQLGQYYRTQKIGSYTINSSIIDIREPDGGEDYDSSTDTRAVHEIGETSQGAHSFGNDDDYFKVTLEAGTTYKFEVTYPPSDIGNNQGLFLNILNEEGMSLHMPVEQIEGHTYLTVSIEQAGTYFIAVQNYTLAHLGDYSLTSQIIDTTEPNGTADIAGNNSSTTTVSIGETVDGNLSNPNDKDWIGFTVEADTIYKITISGTDSGDSSFFYNILDAEGNWILEGDYPRDDNKASSLGNGDAEIYWKAPAAGTYFVEVGSLEFHVGNYEVSVVVDDNKEPDGGEDYSNTADTRGVLEVGGSIQGNIGYEMDGADRFKVELEEGKVYQFTIAGFDEGGGTIDSDNSSMWVSITGVGSRESSNGVLTIIAPYSGTYYPYVDDWRGTGSYTISVNEINADEPDGSPDASDDTNTTATTEVGIAYEGNVAHESDYDFIAITLEAGKVYHLRITGSEALQEFRLHNIGDAEGQWLNGVAGYGFLGEPIDIYFEAETSGVYHFRIGGGDSGNYPSGNYTVIVNEYAGNDSDGSADVGDTFATAHTMIDGEQITSALAYIGDKDLYAVEMLAGEVWSFTINTTQDSTLDRYFMGYIYNEAGEQFSPTIERDTGDGSRIVHFVVPDDGMYYVSVEESGHFVPGDYELKVEKLDTTEPDGSLDYGNSLETGLEITADSTTMGALTHIGDVDLFTITLEAGQSYQFNLVTDNDPQLQTFYMYISNSNAWGGSTKVEANHTGEPWTFTAKESGTYSLFVGSDNDYIGEYTVTSARVDITEPDGGSDYLNSIETRGTLALDETLQGEISFTKELSGGADTDWVAVELVAGETYVFEVTGETLVSAGILRLYDSEGNATYRISESGSNSLVLSSDAHGGVHNQMIYTAEESGTYYVEVADMNLYSTGTYSLTMKSVDVINIKDSEGSITGGDGVDIFVIRSSDGGSLISDANMVLDFTDGEDLIGINALNSSHELDYDDLTITAGTGDNAGDTIISLTSTGQFLIILDNVDVSTISIDDFTLVRDEWWTA